MIVVAIIGILAAVAIPAYSDYTIKAKMANAQGAIDSIKSAVALCAQEGGGDLTGCNAGAKGVPTFTETKEVKSVTVQDGVIVETFSTGVGKDIDGLTATFTPTLAAGAANVTWNVTTTVANDTAKTALTKNNVGP